MPATWKKSGRGGDLRTKTRQRFGIYGEFVSCLFINTKYRRQKPHTISPNLANAGNNVCPASLCLSTPSNTSTNFPHPALVKISPNTTANRLTCSHLDLAKDSVQSSSSFDDWLKVRARNAASTFDMIFVNRWRTVIHSSDL